MSNATKRLESFLGNDIFKVLQNAEIIDIVQLNAAIALLIKLNIPFILTFAQGTSTTVPTAELVVTLSPTTEVAFLLPFDRGPVPEFE